MAGANRVDSPAISRWKGGDQSHRVASAEARSSGKLWERLRRHHFHAQTARFQHVSPGVDQRALAIEESTGNLGKKVCLEKKPRFFLGKRGFFFWGKKKAQIVLQRQGGEPDAHNRQVGEQESCKAARLLFEKSVLEIRRPK